MSEIALFVQEFARTRRDTGAVAPSSPRLAKALSRYVVPSPIHSRAVLEVGSGTGAVTRHLHSALGPLDTLDLVEANPRFAALLQQHHGDDERVRLRTGLVQEHHLSTYDTVVCGLPFANFDAHTIEEIFQRLLATLRPGGTLSYFSYAGLPPLGRALLRGEERQRAMAAQDVIRRTLRRHQFGSETVLGNLPPARVHHLAPVAPTLFA